MSTRTRPRTRTRPHYPDDPATRYALDITSGRIPSNELTVLSCERHLRDLDASHRASFPYLWRPDYVEEICAFFPHLRHWRDPFAGQPFHLLGWQAFCTGSAFGWVLKADESIWRYRTLYIEVPKKSGKSTWVAGMAIARGFFSGIEGSETYSIAMKRDQATIVWTEAANLLRKADHPDFSRLETLRGRRNISDPTTNSKFEPLGADKDSSDGVNPVCLIADEIHRYKDAHLLNTLRESMSARTNPLLIEITTAGWDRNSICYQHHEYSTRILNQQVDNDRWFTYISCADDDDRDNWDDPRVWKAASPSWGVTVDEDTVRELADEAREIPSKLNDFLRFRLNIWTEQSERAIDMRRWIKSGEDSPTLRELKRRRCFGGLDLASNNDLCAFVLAFPNYPRDIDVSVLMWLWCPEIGIMRRSKEAKNAPYDQWVRANVLRATDGDTTNYHTIREDILAILEYFDLVQLGYDPHNSGSLPHDLADQLGAERIISVYQGHGFMSAPCKELERLYLEESLKHGNNAALNWMANNAAWKVNEYNDKRFDRQKSSEKIDGMVALAMALGCWIKHEQKTDGDEHSYQNERRGIDIF